MEEAFANDLAAVARIPSVPLILEVVCRATGMGFAAVARVTEERWIACAVRDEIAFGLQPGGELAVKSELQDGQIQFSVSDTGMGLPIEKMDQIFSAFFTTKPQGSGMGLAISRSIVESHGGRLWATANDGQGATFHFTLPITAHVVQEPATGT